MFLVGNAAFSLGLMEAMVAEAAAHLTSTAARAPRPDAGRAARDPRPSTRGCARGRTRCARSSPTPSRRWASGRADATLRVLQVKAVAAEAAAEVADGVMRLCGGAAFRKDIGVERRFRDSLAARVMAPTTDGAARLRRPGHARPAAVRGGVMTETLLMGAVAYDPKVVTIWSGFRRWLARARPAVRLRPLLALRTPGRGPRGGPDPRGVELAAGLAALASAWPRRAGRRVDVGGDARHRPGPDLGGRRPRRLRPRVGRPT